MIRAYSEHDSPADAVSMYIRMLASHSKPNDYTFPFLLKSFTRHVAADLGDGIHAHVIKFGLSSNHHVQNALIHMYSVSGETDTARQLFQRGWRGDAVMWNVMISGYNRRKQYEEACTLFGEMEKENVDPNEVTFISVLSACAKLKDLELGNHVHRMIEEDGGKTIPNQKVQNAIVQMYAGCGAMDIAWRLFEAMGSRDVVTWTSVVVGFANVGQVDRARGLFDKMPKRDVVSWTAMIDGYVRTNRNKDALDLFRKMQGTKIQPDDFTMVSMLTACAQLGALEVGEWIRAYMERNRMKMSTVVGNALIDMYSKCGCIESARDIFRKMNSKDKFTWTAMIVGLAINGHGEKALNLFSEMLQTSVRPDEITFIGALSACSHSGFVEEGRQLFLSMITTHGIMPNVAHYGCLVDLLGRAGQLKEALETISNMPMRPNSTVWGALLGASRVYRNVEMAELAACRILELEPGNGACYVLLSNIYAKCNKWDEVQRVRKMMMDRGITKQPGCSLIEVHGEVHEFVAGDRSHLRSEDIYFKLEEMGRELKLAGYVSDTSEVFPDIEEEQKESAVYQHSEKLAVAFGLLNCKAGETVRVVTKMRICNDCHNVIKLVSELYGRQIVVRDRMRFHHFRDGDCSCKNYW